MRVFANPDNNDRNRNNHDGQQSRRQQSIESQTSGMYYFYTEEHFGYPTDATMKWEDSDSERLVKYI